MNAAKMQVHVLDDDQVLGRALARQLRMMSCEGAAFPAVEALLGVDGSPDLLIVDFNLAGTNALLCAQAIEDRFPGVPRVVITASLLTAEERAALAAAGYREIVTKPWHFEELRALLARYQVPGTQTSGTA